MNIYLSLKEFVLSFHIIEFQNQSEGMITMLYCTEDSCTGRLQYCIIILGFIYSTVLYCIVLYFTLLYSTVLHLRNYRCTVATIKYSGTSGYEQLEIRISSTPKNCLGKQTEFKLRTIENSKSAYFV